MERFEIHFVRRDAFASKSQGIEVQDAEELRAIGEKMFRETPPEIDRKFASYTECVISDPETGYVVKAFPVGEDGDE